MVNTFLHFPGFKFDQNAPRTREQRKVFAWLPCEFHDSQDHLQFAGDVMRIFVNRGTVVA